MAELNPSHLALFAKLSKILAQTFEDIHKICLSEAENSRNGSEFKSHSMSRVSSGKQQWLDKRQQHKSKGDANQYMQIKQVHEEQLSKPPKTKKSKAKTGDGSQQNKQKKSQKKKKIAKWEQQGKPRPPINAFMLFLRDSKFQIMQAKPQLTPSEVSSYASAIWNDLTQQQKQKYRSQYRENKAVYDQQIKQYHEKMKILAKANVANTKSTGEGGHPTTIPSNIGINSNSNKKDILDQDIVNIEASDDSESMSGI